MIRPAKSATAVDLTSCDLEPIHLGGMIQPAGFLIAISADWLVARASTNAPQFLGTPLSAMLGKPLDDILSADAVHSIRNRLSMVFGETTVERAFGVQLQAGGPLFDLAMHFVGPTILLEAEPSEPPGSFNAGVLVRSMIDRLQIPQDVGDFTREAAQLVRALTGFHRVMIYRFHADGTGEVVAESVTANVPRFMGLRFPASDIPVQARALYLKNLLRLIVDVDAVNIAIEPNVDASGQPIDLTMAVLRAVSPIHIQYLQNMGVKASMSVSIVRDGLLWGLIACHHLQPRHVSFERRTTVELFTQMFALLLEQRERAVNEKQARRARLLHSQLLGAMANKTTKAENIVGLAARMGELVPHDGVGIWTDGRAILTGSSPDHAEFARLVDTLNREPANRIHATAGIGAMHPPGRDFADRAAGLLAIPISRTPRDYLVFFRREIASSVTWAGNPQKPVEMLAGNFKISPRYSFEAWREIVRGQSAAWTEGELAAAEEIRIALIEVVLRYIDTSVDKRRDVVAQQGLLIAELNHRVRNILGLVKGLVARSGTSEPNVAAFRDVLGARVLSLARAHDQITEQDWAPASLGRLIAVEADAYCATRPGCVVIAGPDLLVQPRAFTTLALLIHELMTNSAKYGAIGSPQGVTTVTWSLDDDSNCILTWQERGGPEVHPPARRGFGSTIIERSISHELGGKGWIDYATGGVHARFVVPAAFVSIDDRIGEPILPATKPTGSLHLRGPVLLVEDNIVIALDAEAILLALGVDRVDVASDAAEAMRIIEIDCPRLAILDINIGAGTSFAIAQRLSELGVPIIFASGMGAAFTRPPGCEAAPVITKPYAATTMARAIHAAVAADNRGGSR